MPPTLRRTTTCRLPPVDAFRKDRPCGNSMAERRRDLAQLNPGFVAQALLDRRAERQIDDGGPLRRRHRRHRHRTHHQVLCAPARRIRRFPVGHEARESVTRDPRGQRFGWIEMLPGANTHRLRRRGSAFGQATAPRRRARVRNGGHGRCCRRAREVLDGHDGHGRKRKPRRRVLLARGEPLGTGRRFAFHLEHHRLCQKPALIDQRAHARLHEIRTHVEEQHEPGEQEERDDQQTRNKADKDIRENELAAYSPQQSAFGPESAARETVERHEDQREAADRVDGVEYRIESGTTALAMAVTILMTTPNTSARPGNVWSSHWRGTAGMRCSK